MPNFSVRSRRFGLCHLGFKCTESSLVWVGDEETHLRGGGEGVETNMAVRNVAIILY